MKIKLDAPDAQLPTRGTDGAGAFDCYAYHTVALYPGEQRKMPLGFSLQVPDNHVALLVPRSSTGSKGLHLGNVIGVIDSDYRGPVIAALKNNSNDVMTINRGERICQMLIIPVWTPTLEVVTELSSTTRGAGAFGSTGA